MKFASYLSKSGTEIGCRCDWEPNFTGAQLIPPTPISRLSKFGRAGLKVLLQARPAKLYFASMSQMFLKKTGLPWFCRLMFPDAFQG